VNRRRSRPQSTGGGGIAGLIGVLIIIGIIVKFI